MSKYSDKVGRRKEARLVPAQEPEDVYSILPDYSARVFFRAKAGLYGMVRRTYSQMRLEVSPYLFKRLLNKMSAIFVIPLSVLSAEPCGELSRDFNKGKRCGFWVYSMPYGGRMKVFVLKVEETHSPQQMQVGLRVGVRGQAKHSRALLKSWLLKGGPSILIL